MDLELIYKECAARQVKNFYKNHFEEFKSLSWDLPDVKQKILTKIWQVAQIIQKQKPDLSKPDLLKYLGSTTANALRGYVRKALTHTHAISIEDFGDDGLHQTDDEILASLYETMKMEDKKESSHIKYKVSIDNPNPPKYIPVADLHYAITYKKLCIGKSEQDIVKDLLQEGICKEITRTKVSNIFWKKIVSKYRRKGSTFKNHRLEIEQPKSSRRYIDDYETPDPIELDESLAIDYATIPSMGESDLFDNIKGILTDKQFYIIEKVFKDRMGFTQIANELSISEPTVCIQYYRALKKIRKIIKKDVY